MKYLSLNEQESLHRALRRSSKIVYEPKEKLIMSGIPNAETITAIEASRRDEDLETFETLEALMIDLHQMINSDDEKPTMSMTKEKIIKRLRQLATDVANPKDDPSYHEGKLLTKEDHICWLAADLLEKKSTTLQSEIIPFPVDYYNPHLRMGDKVRMYALGDNCQLEGKTGTLVGVTNTHVLIHWIVELDEPTSIPYGFELKCVQMPSVCLERIIVK